MITTDVMEDLLDALNSYQRACTELNRSTSKDTYNQGSDFAYYHQDEYDKKDQKMLELIKQFTIVLDQYMEGKHDKTNS